ncbi:MAG: hypothetical protein JF587_21420 [Catenulisporales bacterium]|nr:hypothetical protein [Catenulisporales bacterium]
MRTDGERLPPLPSHPTIDDYERTAAYFRATRAESAKELGHLRELALVGARLGTMRPAEMARRVRPAALPVTLLMEPEPELAAAKAAVVRAIARGAGIGVGAGAGTEYWARMVGEIEKARGSVSELAKGKADPEDRRRGALGALGGLGGRRTNHDLSGLDLEGQRWRPANVMLALAPPLAARAFLASGATIRTNPTDTELTALRERAELILGMSSHARERAELILGMSSHAPLCRELVEHAFGSLGDAALRVRLAENPFTPDSVLSRLLDEYGTEPEILDAVRLHQFAGGAVRRKAFLSLLDDPRAVGQALHRMVTLCGDAPFLHMVIAAPDRDVAWVRAMVRAAAPALGDAARLAAYARLAEMSAAEVVWAVELERAGSLERMMPQVRESMLVGTVDALVGALDAERVGGAESMVAEMQRWRSDAALDDPIP